MMNPLSIPPLVIAGTTLYVALYHLFIYFRRKIRYRADLTFSMTCMTMVFYDIFCTAAYNTSSIEQGIGWQKAQVATLSLIGAAFIWFIIDFTAAGSKRIRNFFTVYFLAAAVVCLLDPTRLSWHTDIPMIKTIHLPFHLSVIYHEIEAGPLTGFLSLMGVGVFIYILWIGIHLYRSGNKTKVRPLLWSVAIFFAGLLNDAAVQGGLYTFIYIIEYAYLGIVVLMALTLSDSVVKSAELSLSLEETDQKMAETSQRLAENSDQVSFITDLINQAMTEVSQGTRSQNSEIRSTRQSLSDLLNNIHQISQEAQRGAVSTTKSIETISQGIAAMHQSFNSMKEIEASVNRMWKIVQGFAKHSKKIGRIVDFIDDVASRVNVLSMNAAIEASKAGEYGSGFRIISTEIRLLAQRTSKSTLEIGDVIRSFQQDIQNVKAAMMEGLGRVNKSVSLTSKGRETLDAIFKVVEEEQDRLQSISERIQKVRSSSIQVEQAMNVVATASEQNLQMAERVDASTKEMSRMIADLNDVAKTLGKMGNKA